MTTLFNAASLISEAERWGAWVSGAGGTDVADTAFEVCRSMEDLSDAWHDANTRRRALDTMRESARRLVQATTEAINAMHPDADPDADDPFGQLI